jgi:hypothetical protein
MCQFDREPANQLSKRCGGGTRHEGQSGPVSSDRGLWLRLAFRICGFTAWILHVSVGRCPGRVSIYGCRPRKAMRQKPKPTFGVSGAFWVYCTMSLISNLGGPQPVDIWIRSVCAICSRGGSVRCLLSVRPRGVSIPRARGGDVILLAGRACELHVVKGGSIQVCSLLNEFSSRVLGVARAL